jgi:tetratricopeptide (TPR) repeat protein
MKNRVALVLVLFATSVLAQTGSGAIVRRLRVRIAFDGGTCDSSVRVTLIGHGGPVAQSNVDDRCSAEFLNVLEGNYQVRVSGGNLPPTDAGMIDASLGGTDFDVQVKARAQSGAGASLPSVSARNLAIPSKARKEFDKANDLIGNQKFDQAIERLNKAILIYPTYAGAYNNLGVIYARTGDSAKAKEAFAKALNIDDHFAEAYVNEARLDIKANDFARAENALSKAAAIDPAGPMTLLLLTYAEFMNGHPDQAIATSKQAHALPGTHAYAHQVAARAFEQKHDALDATAELKLFLKEEPTGARADSARKELAALAVGQQTMQGRGSVY